MLQAEQVEQILTKLRHRERREMDADDDTRNRLITARKAINSWHKKGRIENIPYRSELIAWGILSEDGETLLSDSQTIIATNDDNASVAADISSNLDQEDGSLENPGTGYGQTYDNALAMLNNNRFYSARSALQALLAQLPEETPFKAQVEQSYNEAARKLQTEIRPLIEQAQQYAQDKPEALDDQRNLWQKVLEIDPENGEAKTALTRLGKADDRARIERQMADIAEAMSQAVGRNDLPAANRQLGAIQSLATENNDTLLQADLDDLVRRLTNQRASLREKLGAASTLAVTGNTREAYEQASAFFNANVPKMVDAAGIFGEANAEVDTIHLFKEARKRFLDSLMSLAEQRRQLADEQKGETPQLAQETLQNALQLLDDDLLSAEDQTELKPTREGVEQALAQVIERIRQYEQARKLVLQANEPGMTYEAKLTLYREAKEIYPEYRNLDKYIEDMKDALSAQLAGRVKDEITRIRLTLGREEFATALEGVKTTRTNTLAEVPQPKRGSELEETLEKLEVLEQEIIAADSEHHAMMMRLQEVDDLLNQYASEPQSDLLAEVRMRLESLPPQQAQHPEVRQRRVRLTNTQGDRENWRQGYDAYRIREWADAITFLEKVADSPRANKQREAEQLKHRAQAALYIEEARQAELEREWGRAIDRYKEASHLFDTYGSDDQTSLLHEDSRTRLENLKPLEENDQRIRNVIAQAEALLREARNSDQIRTSLLARVEPVSQYKRAVNLLLDVRHEDTTLTSELEKTLRDAREAWRKAYLGGMKQAARSKDVKILQKAVALGEELKEQDLLYEADDKQTLQQLQEQLLDTEYKNLTAERAVDPTVLEENRRRRWEIANPKTDDLYAQYQQAVEQRVLLELSEERNKGLEAALHYLKAEMRKPELYQSERLFHEFMHLCWITANWEEARRQAESLAYRAHVEQAKLKSKLWVGLTQAAQLLGQGNLAGFDAELKGLLSIEQEAPALGSVLEKERDWLSDWRTEKLIREAQEASNGQADKRALIRAAQLYAEAHHLKPSDVRVQSGLVELGRKLNNNLEVYTSQARNITIRRSLKESIGQAEELSITLISIQKVQHVLNLDQEITEALLEGVETIEKKLTPWRKVQAQLDGLDKQLMEYLTYPELLRPDGSGGWRVHELVAQTNQLLQEARGDRELMQLITAKTEQLNELDDKAQELNRYVQNLAEAIKAEEFVNVLEAANQLERLWNQYKVEGFGGLDLLIRHRYSYTDKELRQLREHKEEAKNQQANLEEWQNWAEQVKRTYQEVKGVASRITSKDLDDLRQEKSLKEIKKDCELILEKSADFEEALDLMPVQDPMSQRAAEARDAVRETWRGEVLEHSGSYREIANKMLKEIDQDLANFAEPLRQMKTAIRILEQQIQEHESSQESRFRRTKPFPHAQLRNATKRVKTCQGIDPGHDDVVTANKRLKDIRSKYGVK